MSRKILIDDYASLLESKLFPEMEVTYKPYEANVIVNPKYGAIIGKTIIINLPVEVPLDQLMGNNDIVSRFNTGYNIPIVPYAVPDDRKDVTVDEASCLILNKSMLLNQKYAKLVSRSKFLLGIVETIDGDATLVGERILSTKVEDLK